MKFFEPYYPHFFTATILEWKHLLKPDKYKHIITSSLDFLTSQKRVAVYGFVIMANHIHLIWHILEGHKKENVQRDFMKYTAQRIKSDLSIHHPQVLPFFKVKAKDRVFQIWERNPLSIELYSEKVIVQKLKYMHENPVRARLVKYPEEYRYSSAMFYEKGNSEWKFLSHYLG